MDGKLTKKDFESDQEVRWCPGCGDYAILAAVQRALADLGVPPHKTVFVSGIGCSGRFPYYLNTYGFHGIHGRAPAIATGLAIARPDLSVWIATGDGDALSIGGNHFIHLMRRNVNVNVLLFNNRVYGLTKGQYSPTSPEGMKSRSTPQGSLDHPFNPMALALGAGATFVARVLDTDAKGLMSVIKAAAAHEGTSFIEIYQNCPVFNDGAFSALYDRKRKADSTLVLEHGQPLVFGEGGRKGIRLNGLRPEIVAIEDDASSSDVLVHDSHSPDVLYAELIARLAPPDFPTPVGIFRNIKRDSYESALQRQAEVAVAKQGSGDVRKLLFSGEKWTVI